MSGLLLTDWLVLVAAAAVVGFAKTAIGGAGGLAVVLFALVLPTRESTGAILPVLICGDLLAVARYRAHADWGVIVRLMPWVAVGVGFGAVFVAYADDRLMSLVIAGTLLVLVGVQVARSHRQRRSEPGSPDTSRDADVSPGGRARHVLAAGAGVLAGVTTMVANAAGAVTSIYFLLSGLPMLRFLGTSAWFFLVVNLFKVPFSVGLGLLGWTDLLVALLLLPAVLAGAAAGIALIGRIEQRVFEDVTAALVVAAALLLLV